MRGIWFVSVKTIIMFGFFLKNAVKTLEFICFTFFIGVLLKYVQTYDNDLFENNSLNEDDDKFDKTRRKI